MSISALPAGAIIEDPNLFDEKGVIQPMPAAWWAAQSREDRMRFGHHHALYSFPTVEIIEHLRQVLPPYTIEIGAGNGGYCQALGITGTDSYQQAQPAIKFLYDLTGQPVVKYGAHVHKLDAITAVKTLGARSVFASWVTHRYIDARAQLGGNVDGVDEHELLSLIDDYFFIGNSNIHTNKPIFQDLAHGRIRTHEIVAIRQADIYSRASGGVDFLVHVKRITRE